MFALCLNPLSWCNGSNIHPDGNNVLWIRKRLHGERKLNIGMLCLVDARGFNHLYQFLHVDEAGIQGETCPRRDDKGRLVDGKGRLGKENGTCGRFIGLVSYSLLETPLLLPKKDMCPGCPTGGEQTLYLTDEISTPHGVFEAASVFFSSHFCFSLVCCRRVRAGGVYIGRRDTFSSL